MSRRADWRKIVYVDDKKGIINAVRDTGEGIDTQTNAVMTGRTGENLPHTRDELF